MSYDPISQWLFLPHEGIVRQSLIQAIQNYPQRILDLGCGTGATTLLLKQTFPEAEVIGVDLSPYMLVVADTKAREAGLDIQWVQNNAEQTDFDDRSFDMITASLLFHETPKAATQRILQESHRLLCEGGQIVMLDGNQQTFQVSWVEQIFNEPYIADYMSGCMDAWLKAAGFKDVETDTVWWVQQISRGIKQ